MAQTHEHDARALVADPADGRDFDAFFLGPAGDGINMEEAAAGALAVHDPRFSARYRQMRAAREADECD